jgi:ribosomal protein S18 acetylase RimI-like enzyme
MGYLIAQVRPAEETWVADTWMTGDRVGEIESVSVSAAYRGRGVGTALLDEAESRLAAIGVRDMVIGVVAGNHDAERLYQRRGYVPTFLYLSRFQQRQEQPGRSSYSIPGPLGARADDAEDG